MKATTIRALPFKSLILLSRLFRHTKPFVSTPRACRGGSSRRFLWPSCERAFISEVHKLEQKQNSYLFVMKFPSITTSSLNFPFSTRHFALISSFPTGGFGCTSVSTPSARLVIVSGYVDVPTGVGAVT